MFNEILIKELGPFFNEMRKIIEGEYNKINKTDMDNKNKSYCSYKEETYKDGKLTNKIEKIWENGKLVKDENNTPKLFKKEETTCSCDKTQNKEECCCNKDKNNEYAKIEQFFTNKLQLIEKEVDALSEQLKQSHDLNDKLLNENQILKKRLAEANDKQKELESIFEALRKCIS